MKNIILFIMVVLTFTPLLNAQTSSKSDTLEYKYPFEIEVNALRLNMPLKYAPFTMSVVDEKTLRYMPKSVCVDEPLKLVPGVKVDNQADGERVHLSMRGQGILSEHGIRGIKVMLDGLPLNDPTGFTPDFYDVDWATVNRIEVLRGPAASLYGGSSSAGVLNIMTLDGSKKPMNGEVFGTFGILDSNYSWKGLAQFSGTSKNTDYRVSFSRTFGDGYRIHTHYRGNNIYGKVNFNINPKIKISPIVMYTDFFNENPEGLNLTQYYQDPTQANPDAIPKNEYMETKRFTGGVTGSIGIKKNQEIQFYALGRSTKYTESVPSSVLHREMLSPGGSIQYTYHFGKGKIKNYISIGGDFLYQNLDEWRYQNLGSAIEGNTKLSDETFKQTGIGAFILDRIEFNPQWQAFISGRYDNINNKLEDKLKTNGIDLSGEKKFSAVTGKVGVTFTPKPYMSFYANWGTGFLPPATEELALNPDQYGGFNVNLESATSMGEELGTRVNVGKTAYFDLALFHLKTDKDFDRYRIPTRPLETFYRNAAASQRFGAELYAKVAPIKYFTLQTAYTYSNFKYDLTDSLRIIMDDTTNIKYIKDGNFLPNSPQHQLYVDLAIHPIPALTLGFSSETLSRSYIDGANKVTESATEYTLFHARVIYQWKFSGIKGDIGFYVKNIFSRRYVAFTEPDPGGNSYQPGTPREFFGTLRIGL